MSETNGNHTPTSASMRGGACSPLSGGDGAGTAVAASTISVLAGDANTHNGGRRDNGGTGTDENIRGRAGGGVDCCGGAVIDTESSPQHPTRCIPDAEVSLFDVPVVVERRYIATPPNRDKETLGFSNASAATGVGESVDEEAGAPLLVKPRKDSSISTTGGDSCGDTTGGAEPSSGGDNECRERHQEAW